ncbi:MAG: hypothetical protein HKP58_04835 [Desulfatitalea sp.]|nr:hypothetical protein [Desulfatitalea sp.]NNJ99718.1 hypothetical protein [Desulfatitalea sp.]
MRKAILESWVKYIDLESLEQAKFDPEKTNTKQFCDLLVTDDDIDTVTISFSDHPDLFAVLKEQFPIPQNPQEQDPKPLFLFFPLIELAENNMELRPADLNKIAEKAEIVAGKAENSGTMLLRVADLKGQLAPFESPDFLEYYRLNTVAQQRAVYELSFKFLNLEMVRRKTEIIDVLRDWQDILNATKSVFQPITGLPAVRQVILAILGRGSYSMSIDGASPILPTCLLNWPSICLLPVAISRSFLEPEIICGPSANIAGNTATF